MPLHLPVPDRTPIGKNLMPSFETLAPNAPVPAEETAIPNSSLPIVTSDLSLESTLQALPLHDCQLEADCLGRRATIEFDANPLLPGVIITQSGAFAGMISRQQFLEQMSRPYSLELFFERPLSSLLDVIHTDVLVLPAETLIATAAARSLQRPSRLLHEPIVVEQVDLASQDKHYCLLDMHALLVAQSQIHQLTTQLLHEKTQAHLVQTEKMASLGRMVAGVSHEIKDPVNCINGNLEFLTQYGEDLLNLVAAYHQGIEQKPERITRLEDDIELDFLSEDMPKLLRSMELSSQRLREIVSSLRCFSRLDREKKQKVEIHNLIDSTLLILNSRLKAGIQVDKQYGTLPEVPCYAGQLSQVFMNVLSNGIDVLLEKQDALLEEQGDCLEQEGGWLPQITITTQVVKGGAAEVEGPESVVAVSSREGLSDQLVSIKIADNGTGIPAELQAKIFENFFTTKPVGKGTGLGLAISHEIVTEKHGGQLMLQSEVGGGTVFDIRIPLVARDA